MHSLAVHLHERSFICPIARGTLLAPVLFCAYARIVPGHKKTGPGAGVGGKSTELRNSRGEAVARGKNFGDPRRNSANVGGY